MSDLRESVDQRASRGEPRGASEVFERAARVATPPSPHRTRRPIAIVVGIVTLSAIVVGAILVNHNRPHARNEVSTARPTPATPSPRYQVNATVLQSPQHGPQLCAGLVLESRPPQCGGAPIAGWNWDTVDPKESAGGTTWGDYHLVGTYDGTTFTLTEPPTAFAPNSGGSPPPPDLTTPCPTPAGGWSVTDPAKVTFDAYQQMTTTAQQAPDYAGSWMDPTTPVDGAWGQYGSPAGRVTTVAYSGDLDRHRAEIAATYGGPVCVVQHPRSKADLAAIQQALTTDHPIAGLQVLTSYTDEITGTLQCEVMIVTPAIQQAVDARYGSGIVHLTGALQPAG